MYNEFCKMAHDFPVQLEGIRTSAEFSRLEFSNTLYVYVRMYIHDVACLKRVS